MLQENPGGGYPGAYLGGSPGLTTNLGASRRARQPPGHMTFETDVLSPPPHSSIPLSLMPFVNIWICSYLTSTKIILSTPRRSCQNTNPGDITLSPLEIPSIMVAMKSTTS